MNSETLKKLCVYDLRNYARSLGVPSPTTKTKPELCDEIDKIQKGLVEPINKKQGRRPNMFADFNKLKEEHMQLLIKYNDLLSQLNKLLEIGQAKLLQMTPLLDSL